MTPLRRWFAQLRVYVATDLWSDIRKITWQTWLVVIIGAVWMGWPTDGWHGW